MTATAWTDERIERLRTLWRQGRTAGQIAAELGKGVTRNAVLGKVYRMGLSAGRPERPVVRKPPVGRIARATTAPFDPSRDRPAPTPGSGAGPRTGSGPGPDLPEGGPDILTIRRGQCRWPCGGSRSGTTFCGRPVERGAFCVRHAEAGYRRPPGGVEALMAMAGLA